MALGVYGFGCEDALVHLLNYVWPNIFETSPHLVQAFMDAVEGMRVSLGPVKILQYTLQVSPHILVLSFSSDVALIIGLAYKVRVNPFLLYWYYWYIKLFVTYLHLLSVFLFLGTLI
jgi:hypothetical protein